MSGDTPQDTPPSEGQEYGVSGANCASAAEREHATAIWERLTDAQSAHVLASQVLAMDETSIKAGRKAKGKMRTGWLWPVYGDADEVVFHYAPSRAHRHVHAFLGEYCGTLLSDGYDGYSAYAKRSPWFCRVFTADASPTSATHT